MIPLRMLAAGQQADIRQLMGRPEAVHRLEEMGLRTGAEVEMVQPGSPCIIRLGSQTLCFRADELTSILVAPRAGT